MSIDGKNLTKKQKDIIIAATELFAVKGYAATSTSEIAKKAGVAEGTIFRHYQTKKELLMSIVTPMMMEIIAPIVKKDMNEVLAQDFTCFEDFIKAMIQNRRKFIEKNLPLFRIIIQEFPFHSELKEQFVEYIGKEVFEQFSQMIEHFQANGQIINLPASTLIRLLVSTIFGYIMARNIIAPGFEWDDDAEIERTVKFLTRGLAP